MSELLIKGLDLVVYGMGTVFVFLTLLVLVTMLMSKLVNRFEPVVRGDTTATVDTLTLAAITAAVRHYRASRETKEDRSHE